MDEKLNVKLIQERIDKIQDPDIKRLVTECFKVVPPHFWMRAASAGKHHPIDEHLPGGLALHTTRVFDIGERLYDCIQPECPQDIIRAGCLLHDIARYGVYFKPTEYSLKNHPDVGYDWVMKQGLLLTPPINTELLIRICMLIKCHMGRWGLTKPGSPEQTLVHLADAVAASYTPVKGEKLE